MLTAISLTIRPGEDDYELQLTEQARGRAVRERPHERVEGGQEPIRPVADLVDHDVRREQEHVSGALQQLRGELEPVLLEQRPALAEVLRPVEEGAGHVLAHRVALAGTVLVDRARIAKMTLPELWLPLVYVFVADTPEARDATVTAFQDPEGPGLLIASTGVAAQGLTLTRASNVAFLELEWTPAMHDQAEDRCHRIGQHDAVTAWYLLAADTIDETMAELARLRGRRNHEVDREVTPSGKRWRRERDDPHTRNLRQRPHRLEQELLGRLGALAPRLRHHAQSDPEHAPGPQAGLCGA